MSHAMSRRSFLKAAGIGMASLAVPACLDAAARRTASAAGKRPNILFLYADDHAYQAISAYGSKVNKTPNIDRIAREGMRFEQCYVTNSICGPMRAVVMTGKYSHINGFYRNGIQFNWDQPVFPAMLQEAGYETAIIGKYHLGHKQDPRGFDHYEILVGQGPYYNPPMLRKGHEGRVKHTGYTTDIITDLALEWLKGGRDPDKPFLLMCQHKAPHRNWQPDPKHMHMYDDVTIPEPDSLFESYEGRPTPVQTQDMTIAKTMNDSDLKLKAPGNLTPEQRTAWDAAYNPKNEAFRKANLQGKDLVRWKYQRYMKDYLRCIASVDDNVGRMLDYLDASGLAENTVVIYSSDQGFYLGEHGWFDKRWIYEESLRTALLVRWPAVIQAGSACADIVSPLDFAETFLDLAGAPVPDAMHGRSLVPLLEGAAPKDWRKTLYYQYFEFPGAHKVRRHYGVVDGRYKLVHFYEPDVDEWELVDLRANPGENRNFYDDPAYRDVRRRLMRELKRLQEMHKVPDKDPDGKPHAPMPKV